MKLISIFPNVVSIDFVENVDLKLIQNYCYDLSKNDKSSYLSNRGENSYQSPSLYTKFELNDEIIKLLKEVENKLSSVSHSIGINSNLKIINYWVNINKKHCYNIEHTHPGCLLSAVFYVKIPENSGKINFLNPNANLLESYLVPKNLNINKNLFDYTLSSVFSVEPKESCLIIFPSWLSHQVEPNNSDEDRISIAFNAING